LRERIVGEKCEFTTTYSFNAKDYGVLKVEGENMNVAIVKQGLAKVSEKKGKGPDTPY
jgi:hypothetical protein